jgi:hypothetical protein
MGGQGLDHAFELDAGGVAVRGDRGGGHDAHQ